MKPLFLTTLLLAMAGCGDTPAPAASAPKTTAASQAAGSAPAMESEATLKARYATEAANAITPANADKMADDLLKEIAADQ